jgi:hypothetical protein
LNVEGKNFKQKAGGEGVIEAFMGFVAEDQQGLQE